MADELYTQGSYLAKHPDWHAEDSPWKAARILEMLDSNKLQPDTICEVGCGAGEILRQLHDHLDYGPTLTGYEISPDAFELASTRSTDRLEFRLGDVVEDEAASFDLMLVIDVIEHLEDFHNFLRGLHQHATHTIFHIPLDLSMISVVLRPDKLVRSRKNLGHLHYFTDRTALDMLEMLGYEIVDWTYTPASSMFINPSWKARMVESLRRVLFPLSAPTAVRMLGGYSLLVLAR